MKLRPSKVPGKKAGPNGSFPIGDKEHARLAIGGATRSERAGNISASTEAKIKSEARAELSKGASPVKKALPASFRAHQFKKGSAPVKAAAPKAPAAPAVAPTPAVASAPRAAKAPMGNMESGHAAMFRKAFS